MITLLNCIVRKHTTFKNIPVHHTYPSYCICAPLKRKNSDPSIFKFSTSFTHYGYGMIPESAVALGSFERFLYYSKNPNWMFWKTLLIFFILWNTLRKMLPWKSHNKCYTTCVTSPVRSWWINTSKCSLSSNKSASIWQSWSVPTRCPRHLRPEHRQ